METQDQAKMVLLQAIEERHVLEASGPDAYTINWISARNRGWSANFSKEWVESFPLRCSMDSYEDIPEEVVEAAAFLGILHDHREATA